MDANGVLDCAAATGPCWEFGIEVVDRSLAVAAKRQAVCHVSSTVLAQIECMLALMRVLWVSAVLLSVNLPRRDLQGEGGGDLLRHDHLRQRQSVEDRSNCAFVVVCDVV